MAAAQREVEVASKLVRFDAKRRSALSSYSEILRWEFKWANPQDDSQTILRRIAQKIALHWDKSLIHAATDPATLERLAEYQPSLARLATKGFPQIGREVSTLPMDQVVEYLELLAIPSALRTQVGETAVMSGLARLLILRTIATAESLDSVEEEPAPFTLQPRANVDWHPSPEAGINDHAPWVTGVAQLHACMSGWDAAWTLPPRPTLEADVLDRCAYFAPLSLLMFGCLSWVNPAVGIARWINQGMPTDEPVLKLIKRQWGKWAFAHALSRDTLSFWTYGDGYDLARGLTPGQANLEGTAVAARSFLASSEYGTRQLQFADELHMQTHIHWQLWRSDNQRASRTVLVRGDRAVISLEEYSGWWRALQEEGDSLVAGGEERSVHLLSKGIGLLGEFHRSRVTGRWHVGAQDTHLLGWVGP
ncbi:hypothetical protein [Paenarthrobacter sp. NPDC089316]|uniref:hypothetical protein n=1 Tax=unclassified Paenarthrobacter TaxID=2634190 RepID=UPI003444435E